MLSEAVKQVQKLKLQTFSRAVITQHVHIPSRLAKQWIKGILCPNAGESLHSTQRMIANGNTSLLFTYAYRYVRHHNQ